MPNKASAKKAIRQDEKRARRNKLAKAELKSLRVKLRKTLALKDAGAAKELVQLIGKKLDKAAGKNILKKNTAARYKSRMMKKFNAQKSA
jgi:small subunit ribosomal protein S20